MNYEDDQSRLSELQQACKDLAALKTAMIHLAEAQAHADERVSALIDIIIDSRNEPS